MDPDYFRIADQPGAAPGSAESYIVITYRCPGLDLVVVWNGSVGDREMMPLCARFLPT